MVLSLSSSIRRRGRGGRRLVDGQLGAQALAGGESGDRSSAIVLVVR